MAQQQAPAQGARQRRSSTQVGLHLSVERGSAEGQVPKGATDQPQTPYDDMNMDDLRDLAKSREMKGVSHQRRHELIETHKRYDAAQQLLNEQAQPLPDASKRRGQQSQAQAAATPPPGPAKGGTPVPPPVDPRKDDKMSNEHTPDQPDAGKPFDVTDIVNNHQAERMTADYAIQRIRAELEAWIAANPNADHSVASREASNAIAKVEFNERELKRVAATKAPAGHAKPVDQVIGDSHNDSSASGGGGHDSGIIDSAKRGARTGFEAGRGRSGGGGYGGDNNRRYDDDRDDRRNSGNNNGPVIATILGALVLLLVGGAIFTWLVTRDDNDDNVPANVDVAKAIADAKAAAGTGNGNGSSTGGNTNGGTNGSSSTTGAGGVIISSGNSGGGPNLDAVNTGDCELQQVGADRIRIRSGVLGICTQTFSKIPAGWQMTVDSVSHTVNNKTCTGCTQGFNTDDLGSTFTVTIKDGAAVLGTPEVAKARYCTAYKEGVTYAHDNAINPLPLSSWGSC